ncbi:hypothetical protein [Mycolicibacterium gilvum]|uniref:Uncharacterized protein n=1 Tax=Mycolicibacterium gilvum (strain DSM 45189 / LMG 24558 / Spyr1) TaxID=278137 RepID=E6TLS8_MYCSR|nr:hypothetical protein [Mycolicibacterium gilvum]ADT97100.1 hypothetical protein Mspyr1_03870 [Mycolicibacterium gilvum Spyr1]
MGRHSKDESTEAHDPTPPGPADHGREGGMATREVAPDVAEPGEDRTD